MRLRLSLSANMSTVRYYSLPIDVHHWAELTFMSEETEKMTKKELISVDEGLMDLDEHFA